LYNVLVTEKIKDPSGQNAAQYSWSVAKLKKGQKAVIAYQIQMGSALPLGIYKYSASAIGYTYYGDKIKSGNADNRVELAAAAAQPVSVSGEQVNENVPVLQEEPASDNASSSVLGVSSTRIDNSWIWLLISLTLALGYIVWNRKVYRWKVFQKIARQASGFLSSFF
jgi:hypothetical protein